MTSANVLSAFESDKGCLRGDIVRHAGRIRETQNLKREIRIAFDKKIVQATETYDAMTFDRRSEVKVGFDKTINCAVLEGIFSTIRSQFPDSINDFDCVMLLHNGLPVYCFLNISKCKAECARKKLSLQKERFAKNVKLRKDNLRNATDHLQLYLEEILCDMDEMVSLAGNEKFQRYCALQMDEHSFCLDLNYHTRADSSMLSPLQKKIIACGFVAVVVGACFYSQSIIVWNV